MLEVNPVFESALRKQGLYSEALMTIIAPKGGIREMHELPEALRQVFVTAHEISPDWHIRMQAAFQRYSDNAVSKTINFPENATRRDIESSYLQAYQLGLKGITVYRNNSRQLQPMSLAPAWTEAVDSQHCPDCHRPLVVMEGCLQCPDCHYAKCG